MPNAEEFLKSRPMFSVLVNGMFGEGKTYFGMSFPKVYYLGYRMGGIEFLRRPDCAHLAKNLVKAEFFVPESNEDLKAWIDPTHRKGKLHAIIADCVDMMKKGEVDTFLTDDITYLADYMYNYIYVFEKKITNSGADDVQSMFGLQKRYLTELFDYCFMPVRKHGNLVMTAHIKRESQESVEGKSASGNVRSITGKVDTLSNISPDILGGFRNEIQGKVENSIYLESRISNDGKKTYRAYTSKTPAFGTIVPAKNSLGLPPVIENISYDTLMKAVTK